MAPNKKTSIDSNTRPNMVPIKESSNGSKDSNTRSTQHNKMKPVRKQIWDQIWYQMQDQIWVQVRRQIRDQIWAQILNQIWYQIEGQIKDQLDTTK